MNLLTSLPLELENKIWHLYYMDLYKVNIIENLNLVKNMEIDLENKIEFIKKKIRYLRFLEMPILKDWEPDDFNYNEFNEHFLEANRLIETIINNKSFLLICKNNNNYFNYIFEILKFKEFYKEFPTKYRIIAAYLIKKCNYQKKIINILKKWLRLVTDSNKV